jgi:hypothetical protein
MGYTRESTLTIRKKEKRTALHKAVGSSVRELGYWNLRASKSWGGGGGGGTGDEHKTVARSTRELGYSIWDHILKALEEEDEEQGTTTTVLRATAEEKEEEEQGTTNELLLVAARINLFESLTNGRAAAADDD